MKTDLYTKAVLTVIAIFLGILVFRNTSIIPPAQASSAISSTPPVSQGLRPEVVDVNIVKVNGEDVAYHGIPVEVKNSVSVRKSSW